MTMLKLNKNGVLVQSDARLGNGQGISVTPELVEAGNLYELGNDEDPKVLADRKKLKFQHQMLQKKLVGEIRKKHLINKKKEIALQKRAEKMFFIKKKNDEFLNSRASKNLALAIANGVTRYETPSGVSGFSLSADGRAPVLSKPSYDYQPILTTDRAFGNFSEADNWGSSTSLNSGLPSKNSKSFGEIPIPDSGTVIQGDYTTHDQYLIDNFKKGTYTINSQRTSFSGSVWPINFNSQMQETIAQYNRQHVGGAKIAELARKNEMCSAYRDENGNLVKVKIPFVYGLPIDDGAGKMRKATWYNPGAYTFIDEYGVKRNLSFFDMLSPVIKAYAKYYKYMKAHEEAERKRLEYEKYGQAKEMVEAVDFSATQKAIEKSTEQTSNILTRIFDKLKQGSLDTNYKHPMITRGLIK